MESDLRMDRDDRDRCSGASFLDKLVEEREDRKGGGNVILFDSHNDTLDDGSHSCKVDFMDAIDDNHIMKKLAINVAEVCDISVHTVFLMAMGVVSSVACRKFSVSYKYDGSIPIGLYVIAEQPPGTGKSRCLGIFQSVFLEAEEQINKDIKDAIKEIKAGVVDSDTKSKIKAELDKIPPAMFVTNATPESLEKSLIPTNGYFSAVSSEQGLFNSLLGSSYGGDNTNNNDIMLNGFDGGYVSNMRVSRECYVGHVAGAAIMFAQQNSIEKVLDASNGTGLAERFLLISEMHKLGVRDFLNEKRIDGDLFAEYNVICQSIIDGVIDISGNGATEINELIPIKICDEGHDLIAQYRNSIEPLLADGEKYSSFSIRGAAAKINMQIMKIASILYIMRNKGEKGFFNTIGENDVKSAILIASEMLEANVRLCSDKGIIGQRAEFSAILSLFKNDNRPRTERNIIQVKSCTSPFKEFTGNKSQLIRDTLGLMVSDGLLVIRVNEKANMYCMAQ